MRQKTLSKQEIENIRKYPNKQDWYEISYHYKLTESFMKEFQDKVDWWWISRYQKLSEHFICEFIDKLDIPYILKYQTHLSIEIKNQLKLIKELKK